MDLKLDTTTHDLVIENYDLALVDGIDLVRQAIKQRLLLVLEEWFLDDTIGVPWYQYIFQKGADINRVKSILINQSMQVILSEVIRILHQYLFLIPHTPSMH